MCAINKISKRGKANLKEDEKVYKIVFDRSDHACEECGAWLGDVFATAGGVILNRWRYSHILAKSTYPQHRHNPLNFNNLCFRCHQLWEFGGREVRQSMKIYAINQPIIEQLKND